MTFLRSPASHSIDPSFTALLAYARQQDYDRTHFQTPYWRPSLQLFNAFSQHLIARHALEEQHLRATVQKITRKHQRWLLESSCGEYECKKIILAPGRQRQYVSHGISVFDRSFCLRNYTKEQEILVFGAGMTGVQVSLSLVSMGNRVRLVSSYPIHVQHFDSNPCYIGPKCRDSFLQEKIIAKRQDILRKARYPGSITPQLHTALNTALQNKADRLTLYDSPETYKKYTLLAQSFPPEQMIYAQGFTPELPLQQIITSIAYSTGAPTTAEGFPIPSDTLEWHEGLYLTGMLAELSVGPAAQNIIGAHLAAQRIIPDIT